MKTNALKYKCDYNLIRITSSDAKESNCLISDLQESIHCHELMYPGIDLWFKNKVLPGLYSDDRIGYLGYFNGKAIAAGIVKKGSQAKFCHLSIDKEFQNNKFGELFFVMMFFDVFKQAKEIHFSLPESLWETKKKFFNSFGFTEISNIGYKYRKSEKEFSCSATTEKISVNMKAKLNKLIPSIMMNGYYLDRRILMSIKPKYTEKILKGEKTIEIRKKFNPDYVGRRVMLYSSSPCCAVSGEATISQVVSDHPINIWSKFNNRIGCTESEFFDYTSSYPKINAVGLKDVEIYENPLSLSSLCNYADSELRPPQSYMQIARESKWFEALAYTPLYQNKINLNFL
jgi:predicted transcriptional regulator